jgi:hypothetical protein
MPTSQQPPPQTFPPVIHLNTNPHTHTQFYQQPTT